MFRFTLIDKTSAESLGVVAFMRPDWKPGDVIPQGHASLRVVNVIEPDRDEDLPILVVERAV